MAAGGVSGHLKLVAREKRGDQWYVKYRLPSGKQVQKRLGPAWKQRSRPPRGYFTQRTAEHALGLILRDARAGLLDVQKTGKTFADASAEWLRYCEHERAVKPSTLGGYRSIVRQLDSELGEIALEDVTAERLEAWRVKWVQKCSPSNRTVQAYLVALKSLLKRAKRLWRLPINAAEDLELPRVRNASGIDVYTPEEVWALVRAAGDEQDAAAYLVAAFVGLRMGELLALRWRQVDFTRSMIRVTLNYTHGEEGTPKSDRMRTVPMAEPVAQALARLSQREQFTGDGDLVFCGDAGEHLNPKELRKRYCAAQDAAALRRLRFHDLRHSFGTLAINRASPLQVKTWMGHSDLKTTERYLHYREQADEAELLSGAFEPPEQTVSPNMSRTAD